MKSRKEIQDRQESINGQIESLESEWKELEKESLFLSDETQWYREVLEDVIIKKRPKIVEKIVVGRIYWNENFTDESTGEVITIERCKPVRVGGKWL